MTPKTINNMIETLETARECLSTLACHSAFEGDAVEFSEGGIGAEASRAIRLVLREIADNPDERTRAEIVEAAVYDATFSAALAAAIEAADGKRPGGYRDAMVASVAVLAADRMVDRVREAALAAAADAIDEL